MPIKILVQRTRWSKEIEIAILDQRFDFGRDAIARLTFEDIPEHGVINEPSLFISESAAQQLMDELWQCGLRPSEGSGSAGSLAATERHLKDMQIITMGLLRKDSVEVVK